MPDLPNVSPPVVAHANAREAVYDALRSVLGDVPGIAVIHHSLAKLLPPADVSRWDVLYALDRLVKEGWTLAVAAFTFSFCGGKPFHHSNSPSETGVLADWLLEFNLDAVRSAQPIYSFVVVGPRAQEILDCRSTTTFGDDSPFGLFERENAYLVMLGCGFGHATQLHRYEEKTNVPYRYYKVFQGQADFGSGVQPCEAAMYVRELSVDPDNDFRPAVKRLDEMDVIRRAPLWRGMVEMVRAQDMAQACTALLNDDPLAFLSNAPQVAHRLTKLKEDGAQSPVRIAILGSSNVHMLRDALQAELGALLPYRKMEIFEAPYGQMAQMLIDPESSLRQFKPQISLFCDRLEDLLGQVVLDSTSAAADIVDRYARSISDFHESNGGWVVVHRFGVLARPMGVDADRAVAQMVDQLNAHLESVLGARKQLLWVDVAAEAALAQTRATDARLWHLGRFPFAEPFSRQLAQHWAGLVLATMGKTARIVALDLDNTCWGGVLGEDGISGLQLGGDFPGNAFLAFQRAIKSLAARGIAVVVCSKNDEDLAVEAINTLPDMQFRTDDLAALRINWQPKFKNLKEIADELNLGLESILFVDDNPVEREAMLRNLPGVNVLDLPADPAGYAEALLTSPWLASATVTDEDHKRVANYKARRIIERQRKCTISLEDFYAGLGMRLDLRPLDDRNIARAAQLCTKTNQYNTTTRRYEQAALREIVAAGGDVVVIGYADKHSEPENIGLLILKQDEVASTGVVDAYMLSCRILGRGLETNILQWAKRRAAARGWRSLRGVIIESPRNAPVRGAFRDAGFDPAQEPGEWLSHADVNAPLPAWLILNDHLDSAETAVS